MDSLTPAELLAIEEGICILCGYDDVECLEDCTVHKCIGCGMEQKEKYKPKPYPYTHPIRTIYGGVKNN